MISRGQRRPQISDALSQKTASRPSKSLRPATHLRFTTGDLTARPRIDSDGILLRFDGLFFSERVGFWHAARCPYLRAPQSQISRNNLMFHSYSRLRVFGRESLMTMKMVIAPMTFVSLALLLAYTQPHIPCVVMALAKLAGHVSL